MMEWRGKMKNAKQPRGGGGIDEPYSSAMKSGLKVNVEWFPSTAEVRESK